MDANTQRVTPTPAIPHAMHVVWYRALAELRAEATRTYAGYLWWIIQPLLMFVVYYVAFKFVLPNRQENFAVFLFTGIIFWQWFSVTVQRCAGSLIASKRLMLQVRLHKSVFPFSIMLVNSVKFIVTLLILFAVLLAAGYQPGYAWFTLPALLLVQLLVIAAFGSFAAMISPFIPDFQHILATLLHLAFFVTGIIYDLSILPERHQQILAYNPMATIIAQARRVLLENQLPQLDVFALPLLISVSLLSISLLLIHRFDKVYPKIG